MSNLFWKKNRVYSCKGKKEMRRRLLEAGRGGFRVPAGCKAGAGKVRKNNL